MVQKRRCVLWATAYLKWIVSKFKSVLWSNDAQMSLNCFETVVRTARHIVGGELPPSRTSTPGGVSKTPATRPTDCSLCCPQGDVSSASDPALAD